MALTIATIFEARTTATANSVNAGGFNPANANMLTDLTTDANTANTSSPVVSSASYNFTAGDVGYHVFIKSGTNWTPGWYPIVSVASNKATLDAGVGSYNTYDSTTRLIAISTVAGCATVGTPTGGTFAIDYSQNNTAILTKTDLTCTAGSTTVTSATATFTPVMVGNLMHPTALTGTGALVGWYEIVSYTSGTSVVLDRTPTNGVNNITAGTYYVGGAMSLNSTLDDSFFEAITGVGSQVWFKNGTFGFGSNVSISATANTTNPSRWTGYNSIRGDYPTIASGNQPIIAVAGNQCILSDYINVQNLTITGTVNGTITLGLGSTMQHCKVTNTSSTAGRVAILGSNSASANNRIMYSEAISLNGIAISTTSGDGTSIFGCYCHDSDTGINVAAGGVKEFLSNNVVARCRTAAISDANTTTAGIAIFNNTLYGSQAKMGTGFSMASSGSAPNFLSNNIIYGFTTGVSQTAAIRANTGSYNNFYNNTSNGSNYPVSAFDTFVDPQFSDISEITGTTATTSGSVLTQSGGDFSSVTDNVDVLHVFSGTGVTVGGYLITSHTSTTLTVNNALGTSSAGNVVYLIGTGHNFTPASTTLVSGAAPRVYGTETNNYLTVGAVQPQSSGATSFTFGG